MLTEVVGSEHITPRLRQQNFPTKNAFRPSTGRCSKRDCRRTNSRGAPTRGERDLDLGNCRTLQNMADPPMVELTDQRSRVLRVPEHPERIISLVPSQTELLHDLGLGERVVGITKFCVHPQAWNRLKPRVGGTKKVDLEKIRSLQPDLIIGNMEENSRADIEALEQDLPVWMSDVRNLAGALKMIHALGGITGTEQQARDIVDRIVGAFAKLEPIGPAYNIMYLIWRDPFMAAGKDTFIHDMLRQCGFNNALEGHPDRYPVLTPGELMTARPDLVLFSSEPFPFRTADITEFEMRFPGTRSLLVDGESFSWYGSRLMQAPSYFEGLIRKARATLKERS